MVKVNFILMIIKIIFVIFLFLNYSLIFAESYIKASDGITWDKNNQSYSAEGSVEFKNNEITANANSMIAFYIFENEKEVFENVNLKGKVKILYNDEVFNSDKADYNNSKSLIILYGNVTIVSPDRYLSGDKLTVDLKNNTRVLETDGQDSLAEALIKDE
jgi:lipopolysaccharide export system protein LptA